MVGAVVPGVTHLPPTQSRVGFILVSFCQKPLQEPSTFLEPSNVEGYSPCPYFVSSFLALWDVWMAFVLS